MRDKIKIMLINPPGDNGVITTTGWSLKAEDVGAFPPISLMYLSAALKKYSRHEVTILDAAFYGLSYEDVKQRVISYGPDLVGITAFTPIFYDVLQVAKKVKEADPGIHITLGGPHVFVFPEETIEKPEFDSLVIGEGERIFPLLADTLALGGDLRGVSGLILKGERVAIRTGDPGYIKDIDSVPFPDFEALPYDKYFTAPGSGKPTGVICSSRGCPHSCTFCCKPYKTYRVRSSGNIVEEMRLYYDRGITEFFFFDDMFNITPDRVIDVSKAIISSGMKVVWSFRGRVDSVTKDMLDVARKAGCRQIFFGVEAATDEGLKAVKKGISVEDAKRAVRLTRQCGIESSTNWIIGFPHDRSSKDVQKLISVACEMDSDYAQFNVLIPYHGTELFEEGVKKGVLDGEFWRNYVKNPAPKVFVPIWDEYMTRDELSRLLKKCYKDFYFRPKNILRNVLKIRSLGHLKSKIRGLSILLGMNIFEEGDGVSGKNKGTSS